LCIQHALEPDGARRLTRDEKLDLCLKRISHGGGVPPFSNHANEILVRTLDVDGGNSQALIRIILHDPGLAAQVLRAANSVMYNHSGRPIFSVAHATTLLGWIQVRSMASTTPHIEHFANHSPGLRELVLGSVLTAVQSRNVAAAVGYPRPEEAYICGLLRNIGEVLIGCHFPHEYSRVILSMEEDKIPERAACFRVLDFSWEDVGLRVATGWNMPAPVRLSMQTSEVAGSLIDRSLASITNYGHNLTRALYRKGVAVDKVQLDTVLGPAGQPTLLSVRDLGRIAESAVVETSETFSSLQVSTETMRLSKQAERARIILESVPIFGDARLTLDRAIQRAAGILNQTDLDLASFISTLLDAVCAAGFVRVVFGLMNENLRLIAGRLASGESGEDLLNRFRFPTDGAAGPILAAIKRREDIWVDRARDGRYDGSPLITAFNPGGFALLPIVIQRKTVACIYADLPGSLHRLDAVRPAIGRVRDLIAQAICKQASQSEL
jgi:HD-like signal output (HDOD) protein